MILICMLDNETYMNANETYMYVFLSQYLDLCWIFICVPISISVHIGSTLSAPSKYHARGPVGSSSETHHEEHRRSLMEC